MKLASLPWLFALGILLLLKLLLCWRKARWALLLNKQNYQRNSSAQYSPSLPSLLLLQRKSLFCVVGSWRKCSQAARQKTGAMEMSNWEHSNCTEINFLSLWGNVELDYFIPEPLNWEILPNKPQLSHFCQKAQLNLTYITWKADSHFSCVCVHLFHIPIALEAA